MRSLPKFFLVTFCATWICWAASFAISNGSAAASPWLGVLASAVFLLGVFTPALVALVLTDRTEGRAATQSLFSRIFKWDVGWRWYLFAVAYMAVVKLSVAGVHRMVTCAWRRVGRSPWYVMGRA